MALIIKTTNPTGLLSAIKKAIDDKEIDTWSYDEAGDFTHVKQWNKKAWLRPIIVKDELQFGIIGHKEIDLTRFNYGVYHGRYAEMLVNHFNSYFSMIIISPNPIKGIDIELKLV